MAFAREKANVISLCYQIDSQRLLVGAAYSVIGDGLHFPTAPDVRDVLRAVTAERCRHRVLRPDLS
jgi:hypothetical protein